MDNGRYGIGTSGPMASMAGSSSNGGGGVGHLHQSHHNPQAPPSGFVDICTILDQVMVISGESLDEAQVSEKRGT